MNTDAIVTNPETPFRFIFFNTDQNYWFICFMRILHRIADQVHENLLKGDSAGGQYRKGINEHRLSVH